MKIIGGKRWVCLILVSLLSGFMVYVPYMRFSYLDQMALLFCQYKPITSANHAYEFVGNLGLAFGLVSTIGYPFGGIFADKFSERDLMASGAIMMGIASLWYAFVPGFIPLLLIHILYGIAQGFLIFSAYLKCVRKLGSSTEQGRMYSISEFVRAIIGTVSGFIGVALLGKAVLPDSTIDPQLLGTQWKHLMLLYGTIFIVLGLLVFLFLPRNILGMEEDDTQTQEAFNLKNVLYTLKLPGVWMISMLIFFGYSIIASGGGYLGSYTMNVLGISSTQASSFAVIRTYIIAILSCLAIGFLADKIGSKVKTLGIYLALSAIVIVIMLLTEKAAFLCIIITFLFAVVYTGMKGIFFATLGEVGIPLSLTGVATGIISLICYLPDVYFPKMAGAWIDQFGNTGYTYIWYWTIGCAILGVITAYITCRYSKKLQQKTPLL